MIDSTKPQNSVTGLVAALRRLVPAALTLVSLWLAVQGQRLFSTGEPVALRDALERFLLAALCLVVARLILLFPATPAHAPIVEAAPRAAGSEPPLAARLGGVAPWRVGATLLAVGLSGALAWGQSRVDPYDLTRSFAVEFLLWLLACALAVGAWLTPLPDWSGLRLRAINWVRANRLEVMALSGILLVAALLRFVALTAAPFAIGGDEGTFGLEALKALRGEARNPFGISWGALPTLSAFGVASLMRLFGPSLLALRVGSALCGTLAVLMLYLLARPVVERNVALVATLFLATFPMHIHYSRTGVAGLIWDSFFFTGTLAAFWWAMRRETRGTLFFALAGLGAGLAQYGYTGSRLLPLFLALALLFLALFHTGRLRGKILGLGVMAVIFGIVAGPLYGYALKYPEEYNARVNQIGILQTGWLDGEVAARGQGRLPILWDQFRRALFGFAYFPDTTVTWGPGTPLAPPLFGVGLFLGLLVSLRRWREPAVVLLHGWFWAIILTAGMLTIAPPSSNRLVSLSPVACLFAAVGWHAIARALAPLFAGWRGRGGEAASLLLGLLALVTALTGIRAHQGYLANNSFGGPDTYVATRIGYALAAQPRDTTLVLSAAPRFGSDISPLMFLTPDHPRLDLNEPLTAPPTNLPASGDLLFITLPERVEDLAFVRQLFPTAQGREVHRPDTGELLFYEMLVER